MITCQSHLSWESKGQISHSNSPLVKNCQFFISPVNYSECDSNVLTESETSIRPWLYVLVVHVLYNNSEFGKVSLKCLLLKTVAEGTDL